jgi:hypothetical protein
VGPTEVDGVHDPRPGLCVLDGRHNYSRLEPRERLGMFYGKVEEERGRSSMNRFGRSARLGRSPERDWARRAAEGKRKPGEPVGVKSQSSVAKPLPKLLDERRKKKGEVT